MTREEMANWLDEVAADWRRFVPVEDEARAARQRDIDALVIVAAELRKTQRPKPGGYAVAVLLFISLAGYVVLVAVLGRMGGWW